MGESNNVTVNNNNIKKDNDTKKIITMIVLICALMIGTTGATYAYFALTATNDNTATGTAATASLTLTVVEEALGGTETSEVTQTGKMVPQLYAGLGTAMSEQYKCVDTNGNTVCKAYTVTVTNGSTAAVKLSGTIQFSGNDSMPNLRMARTTNTTTRGSNTIVTVGTGTATWDLIAIDGTSCVISTAGSCDTELYAAGESKTYYFVVWINETNAVQTDSGTWVGTITFQGENGKGVTSTITA